MKNTDSFSALTRCMSCTNFLVIEIVACKSGPGKETVCLSLFRNAQVREDEA